MGGASARSGRVLNQQYVLFIPFKIQSENHFHNSLTSAVAWPGIWLYNLGCLPGNLLCDCWVWTQLFHNFHNFSGTQRKGCQDNLSSRARCWKGRRLLIVCQLYHSWAFIDCLSTKKKLPSGQLILDEAPLEECDVKALINEGLLLTFKAPDNSRFFR